MATNAEKSLMIKLVVGLYDAAPGRNNLADLLNAIDGGMTFSEVADVLDSIAEFTYGIIGSKSDSEQVAEMLSHFGLTAGMGAGTVDEIAETYFATRLATGDSWGEIILDAVVFLSLPSTATDPLYADTVKLLDNKAAVAAVFSETYNAPLDPLNLLSNVQKLQAVLAGVTLEMDTPEEIDAYLTSIGYPPGAVTLTEGVDILSGHVFLAPRGFTPGGTDQVNTLNDDDVLTGTSATNDRLDFTFVNDADTGDNNINPTMNGIEIADIEFATDFDATLDLQDSRGFTHVNLHRIDDGSDVTIDNIAEATTNNLSINNSNAPGSDVNFAYIGTAVAGPDDEVNLTLNNAQVDDVFVEERGTASQGFETVNLISTGGAANSMESLGAEDVQTLNISGDEDLSIFGTDDIVSVVGGNTLVEGVATTGGLINMAGSLTRIDASGLNGNLAINLNDVLTATADGTSGTDVAVTVIGGAGDDTFWIGNGIGSNDTIDGGTGGNTAILTGGAIDGDITQTGRLEVRTNTTDDVEIDTARLPDLTDILVRNEGHDAGFNAFPMPVDVILNNVTEDVALNGIDILHGTTGNNDIDSLDLTVDLETDGSDDSVVYTIAEGVNRDPRFNFTLSSEDFENVTIEDNDSESNSVEMNGELPTGTLTITGGEAGDFLNFDVDTDGADVTNVTTGADLDDGEVQQGLLGIATDGSDTDADAGNIFDVDDLATQVRQVAATIDASAAVSNIIIRVSTNENDVNGAQNITTGTGDDTVIFDNLNDATAGLTISDTVAAGDGDDTLVIDGHGTRVSLGASEWTNVSGFETIRLVGNDEAALSTRIGQNSYNLALTNDLIDTNGGDLLHIINDNDVNNDEEDEVDTATTGNESAVTIDARSLSAQNHFTYNGEEGVSQTVDKFILADANVNGGNIIDGGALDNTDTTWVANTDVLEVRNTATVTTGDLANISNVGIIAGTNDQAVDQTLNLVLNDTVIDALVDSYHTSSTTEVETLTVRLNDANDVVGPAAGMGINLDTSATTARSAVDVSLDDVIGATDALKIGFGLLRVGDVDPLSPGYGVDGAFESTVDTVQLSVSKFGLTLDADDIGTTALTDTDGDLTNIEYGVAAAVGADTRIVIDTVTNAGLTTEVYYDPDGSGAQSQVLIATIANNGADLLAANFIIVA